MAPPPPPSRTKWTRRVPHPVLIGHAASLTPYEPGELPVSWNKDRKMQEGATKDGEVQGGGRL
jgi:hypothetical protein